MTDPMLIWGLALLAAAVLLVFIEVLVPSGGIIGIVATGVAIAGVVCLYRFSLTWGIAGTLVVLVGGPSMFFFALSLLPSTPIGRAMMGGADEQRQAQRELKELEERQYLASLVGAEGEALTDLRPVGSIRIDGKRHEATSDTSYISSGERVRVTGVDMTTLKVRPTTKA